MSVTPSCPVLLVHEDDAYRRALIKTLDQEHFSVTYTDDEQEGIRALGQKAFRVMLIAVDLAGGKGIQVIEHLRTRYDEIGAALIILGEPNPELRTFAPFADETLLKPVDPSYVADRARTYCR